MSKATAYVTSVFLLLFLSLAIICATNSSALAADNVKAGSARYTFAVIPFYTPEKIWALYSPFIDYLNTTTGESWELKLYRNHNELIDAVCNGKVSAALLGPVPLGRTIEKCGATALLTALSDDGKPYYHSVMLTNNPAVKSLKGLKGKKIGFFKGSTAAHIIPAKMLKESGVGMSAIQPVYLESQDRIMSALLAGDITAAGVKESLVKRFDKEKLRSMAVSAPLPNFAICATPSLPAPVRQQMVSALTRLKPLTNSKDAAIMKAWDDEINNGFMTPGKDFLPSVMTIFKTFQEFQHEN